MGYDNSSTSYRHPQGKSDTSTVLMSVVVYGYFDTYLYAILYSLTLQENAFPHLAFSDFEHDLYAHKQH